MTDLVNMWFIASAILITSVVMWTCGRIGESRSSHPQMIFGIKTRTTTRTPEHWYAAHRAAGPMCRAFSVLTLLFAIAVVAIGFSTEPQRVITLGISVLLGSTIVWATIALVVADRAARRIWQDSAHSS
ncbi:SdpI family protein [Luteococcus sp.]|uniref:SdpI family protein n=1 Tax=Luteococcus sp. TaxID=1969402 RepID=UPI0037355631